MGRPPSLLPLGGASEVGCLVGLGAAVRAADTVLMSGVDPLDAAVEDGKVP